MSYISHMKNSLGKLIVFEGIDGSGKTTQLKRAAHWLTTTGHRVEALLEPTYGPHGRILRESARTGRLSPEAERDLFVRDRRWDVETNIRPALDAGKIVLLDRYYFSSIAYQGARGLDPADIRARSEAIAPPPNLVLLFDLDPEIALQRIEKSRGETPNLFEGLEYQRQVREIFLSLNDPCIVRLDAAKDTEVVWEQVKAEIEKIIPAQDFSPGEAPG
jgi:dTMP kinase